MAPEDGAVIPCIGGPAIGYDEGIGPPVLGPGPANGGPAMGGAEAMGGGARAADPKVDMAGGAPNGEVTTGWGGAFEAGITGAGTGR